MHAPLFTTARFHALVAHRATANDGAGAHVACFADVGNQLTKVERHVFTGLTHADFAAVPGRLQRQVQAPALPDVTQLIERHRHRAEGGGRLGLKKAKALGKLIGNQVAQAHIIGQHDQTNTGQRLIGRGAHGDIGGDDGDFSLEINAHGLAGHQYIVTGAEKIIAAALVHQRVAVEVGRHLGAARLAHQLHMVEISRTIGPLIGAWQRRHAVVRIKREGMGRLAAVELVIQVLQLGRDIAPVVQHLLQAAGNAGRIMGLA